MVREELGNFTKDWETALKNEIKILEQNNTISKI